MMEPTLAPETVTADFTPIIWTAAAELSENRAREIALLNMMEDLERANHDLRREIAARKLAEVELRASEERFRLFMDNSPSIAWMKDAAGRYLYVNKAYQNRFGVRLEDCRGKLDFDVWPPKIAEGFRETDQAVLAIGRTVEFIVVIRDHDEQLRHWLNVKFPVRHASGETYVAGIGTDITALKRKETVIQALRDINLAITSTLDLEKVLQTLLEKIPTVLPYEASQIQLLNESTGNFDKLLCHNIDESRWKTKADMGEQSIHQFVANYRKPITTSNVLQEGVFGSLEFYRQEGLVSYFGLPLILKEKVIGVLSLLSRKAHQATQDEIELAETLAKQASIAIHNARLYEQIKLKSQNLQESEKQTRLLANGLMRARDEEAKRIAHVLHDESGQLLAAVDITLDEIARRAPPTVTKWIDKAKIILAQAEQRLRDLSHEIHPTILTDLGLMPSLEYLAAQVSRRTKIKCVIEGCGNGRLSPEWEIALYRVVQESLNNIVHHSRATEVQITLVENAGAFQCSIQDNGVGFGYEQFGIKAGLGLRGMRERIETLNGTFSIQSAPGKGTTVLVTLPKEVGSAPQTVTC